MTKEIDFAQDLEKRYTGCRLRARTNYAAGFVVLVIAVVSSCSASISVAGDIWPKEINAILAALPGFMYLVNRQFRFHERAQWWFARFNVIESLYRGLVVEKRDESEVSKELTKVTREFASTWPDFSDDKRIESDPVSIPRQVDSP